MNSTTSVLKRLHQHQKSETKFENIYKDKNKKFSKEKEDNKLIKSFNDIYFQQEESKRKI